MEKRFRRLRARTRYDDEACGTYGAGFFVRTVVCLLLFFVLAGIRFCAKDLFMRTQTQIASYLSGEVNLSGAYTQSVEAFNLLCDRIAEAQND